jgi:hypothetical protein
MRDEKGNLQLLPDEDELQKPKKPLTPYMLFVRDVSILALIFEDTASSSGGTSEYPSIGRNERSWPTVAGNHKR